MQNEQQKLTREKIQLGALLINAGLKDIDKTVRAAELQKLGKRLGKKPSL